jgi:hypothetical protein
MKNEDYRLFFRSVNEGSFQFVKIGGLMNEVVKFVFGSRILDVMKDCLQNVSAESPRSQFLIKSLVNDSLENCDYCSKFVCVQND